MEGNNEITKKIAFELCKIFEKNGKIIENSNLALAKGAKKDVY